jgi:hypothetical protein
VRRPRLAREDGFARPSKEFLASLVKDRRLSVTQLLQELGIELPYDLFGGVDAVIEKSGNQAGSDPDPR